MGKTVRNVEMLREVADAIENDKNDWEFNMHTWLSVKDEYRDTQISEFDLVRGKAPKHNCGTAMCIAGWTIALQNIKSTSIKAFSQWGLEKTARDILGLTREETQILFYDMDFDKITAAKTLRRIATGESVSDAMNKILGKEYENRAEFFDDESVVEAVA